MPPRLFHGTLVRFLSSILEKGLEEGEGWGGAGSVGVFLSGTPQGALYWAMMAYQRFNDEKMDVYRFDRDHGPSADELIAVLVVEIPDHAEGELKADVEQFEDVLADFSSNDWRKSLAEIGDVRFDGNIPPGWIKGVVKPTDIPSASQS